MLVLIWMLSVECLAIAGLGDALGQSTGLARQLWVTHNFSYLYFDPDLRI